MNKSEFQKKVQDIDARLELEAYEKSRRTQIEMDLENRESNRNRARSVTVGTAFGGTTELMMRSDGGRHIWCIMQPVEVIELIHQLAANVGCHIQITPRQDFSSWRDWKVTEQEKLHYNGHAPFVNDMAPHHEVGANMNRFLLEQEIKKAKEKACGQDNVKIDNEKKQIQNTFIEKNGELNMLGGAGGDPMSNLQAEILKEQLAQMCAKELENDKDVMATKKTVNKRTAKQAARAS